MILWGSCFVPSVVNLCACCFLAYFLVKKQNVGRGFIEILASVQSCRSSRVEALKIWSENARTSLKVFSSCVMQSRCFISHKINRQNTGVIKIVQFQYFRFYY